MTDVAKCELCGEPMPPGEEMFKFHGYSGNCPKPPLPKRLPLEVKGYVPLTDEQKALANDGKELEERVMRWLDRVVAEHLRETFYPHQHVADAFTVPEEPMALLALGKRNIQQGFMWAVRSIFRPARIALPEDETHPPKPLAETVKDAER